MQKDLFGATSAVAAPEQSKTDFLERYRVTIRLDQAIVGAIVTLIVYTLIFSFGVEKGKRFAMAELRAEREKRESMVHELSEKMFEQQKSLAEGAIVTNAPAAPAVKTIAKTSFAYSLIPAQVEAKAPAKAAAAPVREVKSGKGKYTIQLMTFNSKAAAEKEIQRLAGKGHSGFIIPSTSGKKLQVCIDRFETKEKANLQLRQLKTSGTIPQDAYVRNAAA